MAAVMVVAALGFLGTACDPELSRKASGPLGGTSSFAIVDEPGCFSRHVFDATYVRRQGAEGGDVSIEGCVVLEGLRFTGTFVLTTQGGAVLRGTTTGFTENPSGPPPFPFHFRLTVEEGTKRFLGATGHILAEVLYTPDPPGQPRGTIEGTLDAFLAGPSGQRLSL